MTLNVESLSVQNNFPKGGASGRNPTNTFLFSMSHSNMPNIHNEKVKSQDLFPDPKVKGGGGGNPLSSTNKNSILLCIKFVCLGLCLFISCLFLIVSCAVYIVFWSCSPVVSGVFHLPDYLMCVSKPLNTHTHTHTFVWRFPCRFKPWVTPDSEGVGMSDKKRVNKGEQTNRLYECVSEWDMLFKARWVLE